MSNQKNEREKQRQLLVDALYSLSSKEDYYIFLNSFLSPREFDSLAQRLAIAINIIDGNSYESVKTIVVASTATIGKVKRSLFYSNTSQRLQDIIRFISKNVQSDK